MNFQISGHQTALISTHFMTKFWAASLPEKVQDVNDLRWHPIDVRVEVEYSIIDINIFNDLSGTDVSMPAFEPQKDIMNILHDIN